jgi:CO/xanthine dehydrogenase Mo-binding subunit
MNDFELLEFKISRRAFLGGTGGLAFAFTLGIGAKAQAQSAQAQGAKFNAYVSIEPDGTITIQQPVAEMGQGISTGLPLIVAEELDADWSRVKVVQSPIDPAYHHPIFKAQYVVASISTLGYWTPMRMAVLLLVRLWSVAVVAAGTSAAFGNCPDARAHADCPCSGPVVPASTSRVSAIVQP